jgi:hypothetical protein
MPIDIIIIIYILGGFTLILLVWIIRLEIRIKNLLKGRDGKSLEQSIIFMSKGQRELEQFRGRMESYMQSVENRLRRSLQNVETVRFNPFKGDGSGGNQSFATAFLSEEGNGVVLSSLYSRDRVSIFSKPVKNYASEFELTLEEKRALENAKKPLVQKNS